jgi:hypothetical protein
MPKIKEALQGIALMGAERRNTMKKLMVGLVVCFMLAMVPAMAFGAEAGNGYEETFTLVNSAMGSTSSTATSIYTLKHPVLAIACDFSASPTTAWGIQLVGNTGYSTNFDAGSTSAIMSSSQTVTSATSGSQYIKSPTVVRSVKGLVTAATTTQVVTIRCTGIR